jgi:predicted transcriptional regulator
MAHKTSNISSIPRNSRLHQLEAALAQEEQEFQDTVAALRASMADFEAGRSVSLEEWRVERRQNPCRSLET